MENLILPQRLRELRREKHYTQAFVSSKLNIGRATYSNYELGKRMPSLDIVVDFAKFYQVPLSYLLYSEEMDLTAAAADPSLFPTSEDEQHLLSLYRSLPSSRKKQLTDYASFLKSQI